MRVDMLGLTYLYRDKCCQKIYFDLFIYTKT